MIREWLSSITSQRDFTEWLIIYYVPTSSKLNSGSRFKTGIFGKIKADFNTGLKKDRCIQIRGDHQPNEHLEVWNDITTKIKEGILEAFSQRVEMYQAELMKLESQRTVIGWNFGTFFITKEGLAVSYENMRLLEDSLIQYDELDVMYRNLHKDSPSVMFVSSIGFDLIPNSLLSYSDDSEVKHRIMSNEISLFDFKCYLFARQGNILLTDAKSSSSGSISALRIGEFLRRARSFLNEMEILLCLNNRNPLKVAEWVFNSTRECLQACSFVKDGLVREVSEGRAELKLLTRKSLVTVATLRGWFIHTLVAEVNLTLADEIKDNGKPHEFNNKELIAMVENESIFHTAYRNLTREIIREYDLADDVRAVSMLTIDNILLDYQEKRYAEAARELEKIPSIYGRQGWDTVSIVLLQLFIKCLRKIEKPTQLLQSNLILLTDKQKLSNDQISEAVNDIINLSKTEKCSFDVDNLFSITVVPFVQRYENDDQIYLQVKIDNQLQTEIFAENLTVILISDEYSSKDKLVFKNKDGLVLKPGVNNVVISSSTFIEGYFRLSTLNLQIGGLALSKKYDKNNENTETPVVVHFYPSPFSVIAELKTPEITDLANRKISLEIKPCDHNILSGKVVFRGLSPSVKLISLRAQGYIDTEPCEVNIVQGKPPEIEFGAFSRNQIMTLTVPYVSEPNIPAIKIRAFINYETSKGSFRYVLTRTVNISLSVSVNVQDFFRSQKLFSKFAMSCNEPANPVRILETSLESDSQYDTCSPIGLKEDIIVFPGQPASYTFQITRNAKSDGIFSDSSLPLTVKHRGLLNECRLSIWESFSKILEEKDLVKYLLLMKPVIYSLSISTKNFILYDKLDLNAYNPGEWEKSYESVEKTDRKKMIEAVEDFFMKSISISKNLTSIDQILRISVSVPSVQTVHEIEMIFLDKKPQYIINTPIPVQLVLKSSNNWRPRDKDEGTPNESDGAWFTYNMTNMYNNWLVTGKIMGKFQGLPQDDSTNIINLDLIPLRTGKLLLPMVELSADNDHEKPSFELYYKNGIETALIVPPESRTKFTF
ncbi:hypothetical protein NADFUDRAFT_83987 [Nadsonia fulvescens var. elongata DSM 6958]|uniref:Trafficking protein particle complex subunit 11 domain-containing protein n=1 Tax=Nadsonia fulvescens var. elongata DSM 6958 TaxID=857566 RepID=A0A1E3PES2_9ASCO|nr:hypothetical protein NADFUDRAFT_83987 [Nadsonia fulvescens var. elongata DSM 6958]